MDGETTAPPPPPPPLSPEGYFSIALILWTETTKQQRPLNIIVDLLSLTTTLIFTKLPYIFPRVTLMKFGKFEAFRPLPLGIVAQWTNKQANKQANKQTNIHKQARKQTNKQENKQTSKQENKQTSKQENKQTIEKYS